jgi:hypothetical protein
MTVVLNSVCLTFLGRSKGHLLDAQLAAFRRVAPALHGVRGIRLTLHPISERWLKPSIYGVEDLLSGMGYSGRTMNGFGVRLWKGGLMDGASVRLQYRQVLGVAN